MLSTQWPGSSMPLFASVPICSLSSQHLQFFLHFSCMSNLPPGTSGPVQSSHSWWLFLPLKHHEFSVFPASPQLPVGKLKVPPSSAQPLDAHIFIDQSRANWAVVEQDLHHSFLIRVSEPFCTYDINFYSIGPLNTFYDFQFCVL